MLCASIESDSFRCAQILHSDQYTVLVTSDRETILPSEPTMTSVPIGNRLDSELTEITPLTATLARPSE